MLYLVTCEGSFVTSRGPVAKGGEVEMSEAEAASLPPGTVKLKPIAPKPPPPVAPPAEPPAALPTPPVEAPRSRKAKS